MRCGGGYCRDRHRVGDADYDNGIALRDSARFWRDGERAHGVARGPRPSQEQAVVQTDEGLRREQKRS
jgi:hypothetical protein